MASFDPEVTLTLTEICPDDELPGVVVSSSMLATIPIAFAEGTVVAPHGATYDVYVGLKPIVLTQ